MSDAQLPFQIGNTPSNAQLFFQVQQIKDTLQVGPPTGMLQKKSVDLLLTLNDHAGCGHWSWRPKYSNACLHNAGLQELKHFSGRRIRKSLRNQAG